MRTHLVIPDTQAKAGVPTDHLGWIGQYIVDKKPDQVVHVGDHPDMPSLSSFDKKGSHSMEGRRYMGDIAAANDAWTVLMDPLVRYNKHKLRMKEKQWWPDLDYLGGNHDDRITRAIEQNPQLEGVISLEDLKMPGWNVHPFKKVVDIDGVWYAHYFYQPMTGNPYSGTIENRLRQIGHTFTMGHQQTLLYGLRFVGNQSQHGLVAGACYLHDEDYKGPQGNWHWRGIIMKHEVREGQYDPMFVSLDYLCRRYEGKPLAEFMKKKHGVTL